MKKRVLAVCLFLLIIVVALLFVCCKSNNKEELLVNHNWKTNFDGSDICWSFNKDGTYIMKFDDNQHNGTWNIIKDVISLKDDKKEKGVSLEYSTSLIDKELSKGKSFIIDPENLDYSLLMFNSYYGEGDLYMPDVPQWYISNEILYLNNIVYTPE